MKRTYCLLAGLGLLSLSLVSCSDFLKLEPVSQATDQNFWQNGAEANSAVAGGYALLRNSLTYAGGISHFAYGDLPTPAFRSSLGGEDWGDIGNVRWNQSVPFSNDWRPLQRLRRFDEFYRTIDQANRCIKFIPTIPAGEFTSEAVRNGYLGEAYFLRAFAYFYMARVWGDVPLVLESAELTSAPASPARTPQAQVLEQCVKDLQMAMPLLQYDYNANATDRAVRANRGTAQALLAHVQAWRGDYAATAAAADSVIQYGGYGYVPRDSSSYRSIYRGQSREGIFEITMSASNEKAGGGSIAHRTLRAPYLRQATTAELTLDATNLRALFADSTDARFVNTFAYRNTLDPICLKYAAISYVGNNVPIAAINLIIFRYSDIKLLRAEALAATGQYGPARLILDEVRALAGLKSSTAANPDLFAQIIEERQRELFLEGHTFYDLVRLARKTGELRFGGSPERMSAADFTAGKYYWPIDPLTISLNRSIAQTPFWATRM